MQPIEDFDLGIDPNSLICFDTPEEPHELDAPPQPHSRLRELPGVDDWDRTLRYRGQRIPDLRIRGEQIEAQFRTQSGYLLFVSSRDHAWFLSHLDVYYVLDDFSGAEWASVMTWETGELFQPRWYIWLLRAGYLRHILEVGPQPLRHIEAIDERTVQFYVIRHGWYQLTLHDDPPQRIKRSHGSVRHENGDYGDARYFRILKLWRDDLPPFARIPEYRDYCFCVSDWQNWNAAIERGRVGVNQRRAFAEIFAAEGGSSGAGAAGITDDRLATIGPNVEISTCVTR